MVMENGERLRMEPMRMERGQDHHTSPIKVILLCEICKNM
jgi:hypothetical protein